MTDPSDEIAAASNVTLAQVACAYLATLCGPPAGEHELTRVRGTAAGGSASVRPPRGDRGGCHRRPTRLSPWANDQPQRQKRLSARWGGSVKQGSGHRRKPRILPLTALGLSALAAPAFANDITIGVAGPMTGPIAGIGEQMKRDAETAAVAINDAGGVNGARSRSSSRTTPAIRSKRSPSPISSSASRSNMSTGMPARARRSPRPRSTPTTAFR